MKKEVKTTGKETTTALSTKQAFTQEDIPGLLEKVNKKISELTKGKKVAPVITVQLPGFGEVTKINDLSTLISACSSVDGKQEAFLAAAKKHLPEGIKAPAFKINGHSANEWNELLETRIAEVAHQKELEKLRQVKTKLEENLSQEAKLANDLKAISNILGEDEE
jgi:hypothetical protein